MSEEKAELYLHQASEAIPKSDAFTPPTKSPNYKIEVGTNDEMRTSMPQMQWRRPHARETTSQASKSGDVGGAPARELTAAEAQALLNDMCASEIKAQGVVIWADRDAATQALAEKSGGVGGPQTDDYVQPTPPSIQDVAVHSAIRALKTEPHGNRMGCAQWIEDEEA